MKRIVICCDGTWQSLDNDWPTNVQRMAQFLKPTGSDGLSQVLHYDSGVGLRGTIDRITGGAFGHGLDMEVREAYRFLSLNYEAGDEICLFGFSRGAFTVRSLAGLIYCCGIVKRNKLRSIPYAMSLYRDREIRPADDECVNFRHTNSILEEGSPPTIHFMGCWDTVGALGIPDLIPIIRIDEWFGRKYEFHDTNLGSHILHARHAVAIDEQRKVFDVTPMQPPARPLPGHTLKEHWFAGDHGCVGGGSRAVRQLSDCSLLWMIAEAEEQGLQFDHEEIRNFTRPDPIAPFEDRTGLLHDLTLQSHDRTGPASEDAVSDAARQRWSDMPGYRPRSLLRVLGG